MLLPLAIADSWVISAVVGHVLIELCIGVILAVFASKLRRMEGMDKELKSTARALIDTQISKHVSELNASILRLGDSVVRVNARLHQGDEQFSDISEKVHDVELKIQATVSESFDRLRKETAEQQERLEDRIDQRISRMQSELLAALKR